jgi:histidinol-phosphatase
MSDVPPSRSPAAPAVPPPVDPALLQTAVDIAREAGEVTRRWFRAADLVVDSKADGTPVTAADRAAERLVRERIAERFPRDGVIGEEEPEAHGDSGRRWIIDPIDGTKNFVRGVPVWATLIALVDEGEPVVGVVSAPALGKRWWAAKGAGAYMGRSLAAATRLKVSNVSELSDASLSYSSLGGWKQRGNLDEFIGLTEEVWRTRAYGDFWSYCLVAEGAVDIACEPELNLYDMAALVPIVTEAGGRFTSLEGEDGPFGGNALATNSILHSEVLKRLNPGLDDLL